MGAIINEDVRLFDPLRSTPVPQNRQAAPDRTIPATIADLSQANVWDALAGEDARKFPPLFQKVRIEIIGNSELWAPRMARLERFLTGKSSLVISENLMAASRETTSVVNRVAAVVGPQWTRESIGVWPHPENRLKGFDDLDPGRLQERWAPFQVPTQLELKTRTQQLMGRRDEAVQGYLRVQLDYKNIPAAAPLPPAVRTMYAEAAEDALFWAGVCHMEKDNVPGAARQFETYLAKAEQFLDGRHTDHCRMLLARCLAQLEQCPKRSKCSSRSKPRRRNRRRPRSSSELGPVRRQPTPPQPSRPNRTPKPPLPGRPCLRPPWPRSRRANARIFACLLAAKGLKMVLPAKQGERRRCERIRCQRCFTFPPGGEIHH